MRGVQLTLALLFAVAAGAQIQTSFEWAMKKSQIMNYVTYAAESGGERALPFLLTLLRSSDSKFERPIGVSTLADTGSRAVVPLLIELLRSGDPDTASRALAGLRQITHHVIGGPRDWYKDPQSQYVRWLAWWNREGNSAQLYKGYECGDVTPLP